MKTITTDTAQLDALLTKIERRTATIGVIGLGYVGLPLALIYQEAGFHVIGFDTDRKKSDMLERGESYIKHIGPERVRTAFESNRIIATTDFAQLAACDAILICVPTPLGKHREPDLKYVQMTAEEIAVRLRPGQLVVLESTTYPGTTREELLTRFEEKGLQCGHDFFLAFSPEREDPGNPQYHTKNIPKIVGGMDGASQKAAVALYAAGIDKVVSVSSPEIAESAKLLENIFRSVNIALVNELKVVFDRMGINIWEVIDAAKTKPFGFMPFYPGPGLGGHCIPLDPFYLSWRAAAHGEWARFVELAGEINTAMPRYVVAKVADALNADGKSVNGSAILILGVSYKADVDDDRESPSFEILELLREKGASVEYCDPFIPKTHAGRRHNIVMTSRPCDADEFGKFDAVVLLTAHTRFKDPELYARTRILVDTRNAVPEVSPTGPRIVRA